MRNAEKFKKGNVLILLMLIVVLFLETKEMYSFLKPVITFNGKIISKSTGEGINTNIEVRDESGKIVYRTKTFEVKNGEYYITGLKPDKDYEISIEANGFNRTSENLETPNVSQFTEINKNFELTPVQ